MEFRPGFLTDATICQVFVSIFPPFPSRRVRRFQLGNWGCVSHTLGFPPPVLVLGCISCSFAERAHTPCLWMWPVLVRTRASVRGAHIAGQVQFESVSPEKWVRQRKPRSAKGHGKERVWGRNNFKVVPSQRNRKPSRVFGTSSGGKLGVAGFT